jgi:hypothetical protein
MTLLFISPLPVAVSRSTSRPSVTYNTVTTSSSEHKAAASIKQQKKAKRFKISLYII